ncbi:S9 family peptidase [Polyangium sorediatum]|uniref:DPP IV N-terminal domain-containing protein n=1 Tax=Polyangium sorediatum TaxID=889274 RepID=A0ABT6P766_9BACT|nr:DPP IV N-terminal domain-containing protein [Polyangium sorediatum]MDI1436383.1 DPP IV N-terminal domain-containing protein [Polyangium sorediatum]
MRRCVVFVFMFAWLGCQPPTTATRPPTTAPAQGDPLQARLEVAEKYYRFIERIRDTLVAPRWLPDRDQFVYWSAVGPHRGTWVLVDAQQRTRVPVLSSDVLQAELSALVGQKMELPENLDFVLAPGVAPDSHRIVFQLQGRSFALGLSDRHVVALAPTDRAAWMLSASHHVSPEGRTAAVQRGSGFAVVDSEGGTLLERSGEENYEWQIPERAWSPDGRFLMVWRQDTRGVHKTPIVDYAYATGIERVKMVPYSKVGTPLRRSELYVVEPATRRVTLVPPAPGETYDWFAGFRPDGSEALVLHLSRDGKRLELSAVEPGAGKTRLVLREDRSESFVGALDFAENGWSLQVTPLDDNKRFLWMSERDGFRHVYLYDYAGTLERQVTSGPFPVHRVLGVTPKADAIFLLASAESAAPYDRLLYRASLAGGDLKRLSPDLGMHRITLAPSGRYYTDGHSTRVKPRVWDVGSTEGGAPFRYAEADTTALAELHLSPPEPLTVLAADGATELHGVLYKPWDFDPKKHYPVLDVIYAGPWMSVVPWSFVGTEESRWANSLSQMGFVAMVLDARGTPGRSKAFQDANYGRVGQTEIPDHVAALRQAAATRPYMDMSRVGIYGHSWGGYFALRGMLTAPELFKAGYAGAPGALEEEAVIMEPNLGLVSENRAGYEAGSNVSLARNLRGALKMMHGTSDVNATVSTTMRMAEALIREGKPFELLIMPGQPHSPEGKAFQYYKDDVHRFFVKELGGPR